MDVSVVNTVKRLIAYIESKAVGTPLTKNVFTGPHEERTNKYKQFCVINYEVDPTEYELGDSQTAALVTCNITFGYRDDTTEIDGTEKEDGDTYFHRNARYLRSRQFKEYMAVGGVKVPPHHIEREWHDIFAPELEGIRQYTLILKLITYIETLEDIP